MKAIKFFILFFSFLLVVNTVTALDCSELRHTELCNEVISSNITEEEKVYLINSLIIDEKSYPNHTFIRDWNLRVNFSIPFENQTLFRDNYVKNAWVRIFSVMPSIIYNNSIFNNGTGEVLIGFNHEIDLPDNYTSEGYPREEEGYCKLTYSLENKQEALNLYNNNNLIGSGYLVNFSSDYDMNFSAEYVISVDTKIEKYEWETYCARKKGKRCVWTRHRCRLRGEEIAHSELILTDNISIKYYPNVLDAEIKIKDKYQDTTKFIFNTSNFSSLHLEFLNSEFNEYNYLYDIVENNSILWLKTKKQHSENVDNLFIQDNEVIVKNIQNCNLTLFDHFTKKYFLCNLDYIEEEVVITTDKLIYSKNETILVSIEPSDKEFNVTYGEDSIIIRGNTEFSAKYPENKIYTNYNGKEISKTIHVKNDAPLNAIFVLGLFCGVNYTLTCLIRKYWGVSS